MLKLKQSCAVIDSKQNHNIFAHSWSVNQKLFFINFYQQQILHYKCIAQLQQQSCVRVKGLTLKYHYAPHLARSLDDARSRIHSLILQNKRDYSISPATIIQRCSAIIINTVDFTVGLFHKILRHIQMSPPEVEYKTIPIDISWDI